jgi:hypothetical protein
MTARAELIKSLIESNRFLRTTHIFELLKYQHGEVSEQWTRRLLQALHNDRHILHIKHDPERPSLTRGSTPRIYGLNTRENRAVNERRDKTSRVVPHVLQIANTMVFNVIRPCAQYDDLDFIDHKEILRTLAPARTAKAHKPLTWRVEAQLKGQPITLGTTPDKLFMVKGATRRLAFLLEEDMGSEPVQRESLEGTAIFRKVLAYVFTYETKLLQERYGIPGFRVLFVTNSRERAPPNVFLFIDRETLRPSDIFSVEWLNGKGESKMIERP